jgi:hypothetical protein
LLEVCCRCGISSGHLRVIGQMTVGSREREKERAELKISNREEKA